MPSQLELSFLPISTHRLLSDDFIKQELLSSDARFIEPSRVSEMDEYLRGLWRDTEGVQLGGIEENIRNGLLDPIFENALDYTIQREARIGGGRVDYALHPGNHLDSSTIESPWDHAVSLCEAKRWRRVLDRRRPDIPDDPYNPVTQVADYGRRAKQPYVMLSNGAEWRLLWEGDRHTYEPHISFDLDVIIQIEDPATRRRYIAYFLALFGRDTLAPEADGLRPLDRWRLKIERRGVAIAEELDHQVYRAVDHLLQALQRQVTVEGYTLKDAFNDALVLVYRILFILHAEARGLLPMEMRDSYRGEFSLSQFIVDDILEQSVQHSPRRHLIWARLRDIFKIVDKGAPELSVFRYNGGLLSAEKHPRLARFELDDAVMANVLKLIGTAKNDEGEWAPVDYRLIEVRQLGRIYEGLLERGPTERPHATEKGRSVWACGSDHLKRKKTGSYYTPDELVSLIVERTLTPLVEEREAEADDDETAARSLLNLTVLDPACGSGHFLIGAVDYLAERLMQLEASPFSFTETEDDATDEDDLTAWRRLVTESCIYGVDLNPLAVELAKLSLWLHTLARRRALTYLDNHLRVGNSLVGSQTADLLALPTWTPKGNRRKPSQWTEESGIFVDERLLTDVAAEFNRIKHQPTIDAEDVKQKEAAYAAASQRLDRLRTALDLRLGAWFAPVDPGAYLQFLLALREDRDLELTDDARAAVDKARFLEAFHWEVEFPEIFDPNLAEELRGFDAVIANPPWERVKLQEIEFFSTKDEDIAKAPTKAKRRKLIEALEDTRPNLYQRYLDAYEAAVEQSDYFHNSGQYPLGGVGDVNYYTVFAERFVQLIKPEGGRTGYLCPSGIATDYSTRFYFQELVKHDRLRALYDFENRHIFFPDVHYQFKFAVMIVGDRSMGEKTGVDYCTFIHDVDELADDQRRFRIHPEDFKRFNPNTLTAPILRRRRDLELLRRIYDAAPVLIERDENGDEVSNPWGVSFLRMFDMANDSDKFRTAKELEEAGCYRDANRFGYYKKGEEYWLPLYEGRSIDIFDHRFADIQYRAETGFRQGPPDYLADKDKRNTSRFVDCRYWVHIDAVGHSSKENFKWLIGFRDVTSPTNMRTFISSAIPYVAVGHKLPLILSDNKHKFYLLTNINTFVLDSTARSKGQILSLVYFIIEQLPIFPPERYDQPINAADTIPLAERLKPLVLELVYTAWDMQPFARELGYDGEPFVWNEERRAHLKARIDAAYMIMYGMSIEDADYILETFPIVKRQDEKAYGFFRTKELIKGYMRALAAGDWETVVSI